MAIQRSILLLSVVFAAAGCPEKPGKKKKDDKAADSKKADKKQDAPNKADKKKE